MKASKYSPTLTVIRCEAIINVYVRPRAIIVDGSMAEEPYFIEALQTHLDEPQMTVIQLPENPSNSVGWMAKLDAASLSGVLCLTQLLDIDEATDQ